jgi:hypothetical protein
MDTRRMGRCLTCEGSWVVRFSRAECGPSRRRSISSRVGAFEGVARVGGEGSGDGCLVEPGHFKVQRVPQTRPRSPSRHVRRWSFDHVISSEAE